MNLSLFLIFFILSVCNNSHGFAFFENNDIVEEEPRNYLFPNSTRPKLNISHNFEYDEDSRIVGGRVAGTDDYPFVVSLQAMMSSDTVQKFCGASILAPRWIVTAGHCVEDPIPGKLVINAGTIEAFNYSGTSQLKKVIKIIFHPNYNKTADVTNDIALLKLDEDLAFNRHVQPIELPPNNHNAEEVKVGKVLGWGAIHPTKYQYSSNSLRVLEINAITPLVCSVYWPVQPKMLCLRNADGSAPCVGDSGGPFIQEVNSKPVLVGLTSYVPAEGCTKGPAVYTRVDKYKSFIKLTMEKN